MSGLRSIPRKMSGNEIRTIEESIVTIRTPSVVFDRAIHLYRSSTTLSAASTLPFDVTSPAARPAPAARLFGGRLRNLISSNLQRRPRLAPSP